LTEFKDRVLQETGIKAVREGNEVRLTIPESREAAGKRKRWRLCCGITVEDPRRRATVVTLVALVAGLATGVAYLWFNKVAIEAQIKSLTEDIDYVNENYEAKNSFKSFFDGIEYNRYANHVILNLPIGKFEVFMRELNLHLGLELYEGIDKDVNAVFIYPHGVKPYP